MKARHLLTTIGMAALMLSSGAAYAQNKMTIGFSQVGSESGWRAAETKVSKIEAEKRGVDLKISDAQQKQENQIRAVRSFIAQGVDAIFIAPVVVDGLGRGSQGGQGRQDPGGPARPFHRYEGRVALSHRRDLRHRVRGQGRRRVAGEGDRRQVQRGRASGHRRLEPGDQPQEGLRSGRRRPTPA